MSLTNEERKTLVALEMKKARETYEDIGGHQVNTHKGSHALFSQHYIKTGILPREYGQLYNQLQTMREESDYNCAYDVEIDELQQRIDPARRLIDDIDKLVNKQ